MSMSMTTRSPVRRQTVRRPTHHSQDRRLDDRFHSAEEVDYENVYEQNICLIIPVLNYHRFH